MLAEYKASKISFIQKCKISEMQYSPAKNTFSPKKQLLETEVDGWSLAGVETSAEL